METAKRTAASSQRRSRSSGGKAATTRSEKGRPSKTNDEAATTFKLTIYPYITTGDHIKALASQRRREKESELYRDAADIGSLFLAIDGEPGENGRYGALSGEDLARRIRAKVVMALDWLAQHGHAIQTGGSVHGLEALLGLLQQGGVATTPSVVTPLPVPAAVDLSDVPDLVLPDTVATALGIEEEDIGFL